MSVPSRLQRLFIRRIGKYAHRIWPGKINDIIFIVGCPRSGTTVFSEILSNNPRIFYLNEPLYIWRHGNPHLNIWGGEAAGQLYRDANDVLPQESQNFAQWFHYALFLSGKRRLVEKNPLHVFRMRWLSAMFPQSKIIHIYRHGRDVALSLEKAIPRWEGFRGQSNPLDFWASRWNYKMFEDYASHHVELLTPLECVKSQSVAYARTLFVWLCSVWEGRKAANELGNEKVLEIRYENLITDPEMNLKRVFDFIKEQLNEKTINFAQKTLHARSVQKADPHPEITAAIAGELLTTLGYD
jgi:hypothetical protein